MIDPQSIFADYSPSLCTTGSQASSSSVLLIDQAEEKNQWPQIWVTRIIQSELKKILKQNKEKICDLWNTSTKHMYCGKQMKCVLQTIEEKEEPQRSISINNWTQINWTSKKKLIYFYKHAPTTYWITE